MKFGIALASEVDSWRWAVRAEELGFNSVWFYDTQLLNPDVFVCMALAADRTEHIRLGTGVLVPSNRIEPVAANALASINKLAPGRIDFGVGTGFTARRTMGLNAITLARTRTYVERVSALLRGETLEWDFENKTRRIRFLNPDPGLINIEDEIPVWLSAFGPKSMRLTAELGAGWLNFSAMKGAIERLQQMQHCWREVERDPADLHAQLFFIGAVLTGDEATDDIRLMAQAAPATASMFHAWADSPVRNADSNSKGAIGTAMRDYLKVHDSYEPADARYLNNHRGHLMFVRTDETHVTPELVRASTFSGTEGQLVSNLKALSDAGYEQVNVQLMRGHESAIADWARVFEQVNRN